MSDKILTVFHTTSQKDAKKILNEGFELSKGDNQWLGKGVYFYRDLYFAVQWGLLGVIKNDIQNVDIKQFNEKCNILKADLDCEKYNVLDVNTPDGYQIILKLKSKILDICSSKQISRIEQYGDKYFFNLLEFLENKKNVRLLSRFDIIFAEYGNNIYSKQRKNKSDFAGCQERQICVKNLEAITNLTNVEMNTTNISELFNLIKKNRSDKND